MAKEKTLKDPNRLKAKDYFGTSVLSVADSVSNAVMTGVFLLYLTDYAGIGKWGAILGTSLLMFARIFDAVNDPLEGWLMDRAKVGKHGKYRPFLFISILCTAIGVLGLFSLPEGFANSPVAICIWVILFYLMYDIGASFYAPSLLYRSMTLDSNERGKLFIGPRMVNMVAGMVCSALLTIINAVNGTFNNMHTSFALTIGLFMLIGALLSVGGLAMVKERYHAEPEKEDKVKLTDIFALLKENKALRIRVLETLFRGFIWTFLFATMAYYIKWGYCTDLSTGAVDTGKLGIMTLISSMLMFVPMVLGTVIAAPLMKKLGSPVKLHKLLILLQIIPCGILFLLEILGILRMSPIPFFLCVIVVTIACGTDYIPVETLNIECMDYEIYQRGKDRSALCNACYKFLGKAQSSVSSGLIGIILVGIGYEVDSVTDTFVGELSAIPTMLTWFIVIMGLVPAVLGVISYLFMRKYPVTDEIRADMRSKLAK
ncbi:MAG: MFS transporter [Lachnospiraceae bacterium]|nr:MFS transporter [Lachnospiraceae bacterium]